MHGTNVLLLQQSGKKNFVATKTSALATTEPPKKKKKGRKRICDKRVTINDELGRIFIGGAIKKKEEVLRRTELTIVSI